MKISVAVALLVLGCANPRGPVPPAPPAPPPAPAPAPAPTPAPIPAPPPPSAVFARQVTQYPSCTLEQQALGLGWPAKVQSWCPQRPPETLLVSQKGAL